MKYTQEELFKLIGELTGYSHESTRVSVGFMPARVYNLYGESEGLDNSNWGFAISTKLCSTEVITVDAQDKDLDQALWKLAQAIVTKTQDIHDRWKRDVAKTKEVMHKFLEKDRK